MIVPFGQRRERFPAAGAKPGAVLGTHGVERKPEHHCVAHEGFDVDEVAGHEGDTVAGLRFVGEQLLDVDLDLVADGREAAAALGLDRSGHGPGNQHPVHDRFQPQIEMGLRTRRDLDELQTPAHRHGNGQLEGAHRSRAAAELARVEHERRARIQVRDGA